MGRMWPNLKINPHAMAENVNVGLFTYPVLMVKWIFCFIKLNHVPVGEDCATFEITRDIAQRFNAVYGPHFTIPEVFIPKRVRAWCPCLSRRKNVEIWWNAIMWSALLEDPNAKAEKIKRGDWPDELPVIRYDVKNKAGVSTLLDILSGVLLGHIVELEAEFNVKCMGISKAR